MSDRRKTGVNPMEIIKRLEEKYGIEFTEEQSAALRKKLIVICKKIPAILTDEDGKSRASNLWEASVCPHGKRPDHYFTEREVTQVLNSAELDRYMKVYVLSNSDQSIKYRELEKESEALNEKYPQFMAEDLEHALSMREAGENPFSVSYQEARQKAFEIMLEALFLRYFTPIDIELLRSDMEISAVMQSVPDQYTPETLAACKRLMDYTNYYKPKEQGDKGQKQSGNH